jgi:hypothetical protein
VRIKDFAELLQVVQLSQSLGAILDLQKQQAAIPGINVTHFNRNE